DRSTPASKFCFHSLLERVPSCKCRHVGFVRCLAYEPCTGLLASGGGDGRIIFWQQASQARLSGRTSEAQIGPPGISFAHGGAVQALATCSDSGEIFSGDAHGRIRIWDCSAVQHGSRAVLAAGGGASPAILALKTVGTVGGFGLPHESPLYFLLAGDAAGNLRVWDLRRNVLLRQVSTAMTCCVDICTLGAPLLTSTSGRWLLRLAMGGDSSGAVKLVDLAVATSSESAGTPGSTDPSSAQWADGLASSGPGASSSEDCSAEFQRLLTLLREFVAIPTVSTDSRHAEDMKRGSAWLAQRFEELLACTVRESSGCVVARCGWDEQKPLVIFYSHYDVVAAGRGWNLDPWQLTAQDGYLYGRGVSDNKGPLLAQIFAVRSLLLQRRAEVSGETSCEAEHSEQPGNAFFLQGFGEALPPPTRPGGGEARTNGLPVNVLFIVDGSEESGDTSTALRVVQEAREDGWLRGSARHLLVCNSSWIDDERPCICYGMRGVLDLEVEVVGGERDLHSGVHGGLVPEPLFDLMALISSLADASGTPSVPGLLDDVRPMSAQDQQNLEAAAFSMSEEGLRKRLGLQDGPSGPGWLRAPRPGLEALRRTWLLPSLSITEVGKGPKHSHGRHIAHRASAVVSVRTVCGQRHEEVVACLKRHLQHEFAKRRSPNKLEMTTLAAMDGWEARAESWVYLAARQAVAEAWGLGGPNGVGGEQLVLAVREGGTLSMLPLLQKELGCEAAQLAFSQASDAVHLPNERMSRLVLSRAVLALAGTLTRLGSCSSASEPSESSMGKEQQHRQQ
ncbi:unnamed protein product, partial [Polarella glacialis]